MKRFIWTGKGPAISKQVQAMARHEDLRATQLADTSLLQDIDDTAPNYSAGLSGRLK